ncbi:YjbH domain-containing protein [Sporomusa sphaeroides]|uniref:YjbH domain-containing protein n=1 Tax=Sporomusa sphaeroides TaxID=47679 RepID=UPI002D056B9B|nr:YjbH domain-containing protein [Sporomusa sphaeroides]HML34105.1 YjbH domain-containing protein [Sporomusa sphaeroides]
MKKTILAAAVVLLAAAPAYAAPSINGSTGLINTPTADVLQAGQFSLGYYHLKEGGVGTLNLNLAKNLELGVAGFRYDSDSGRDNDTLFNLKYGLLSETVLTPGLAVGVEDIGNDDKRTHYAAASKGLPLGFRIHAGVGDGRYDGVFAAIEKTISPVGALTGNNIFPATTLIAEWDGDRMNYGARMSIVPGLKIDAGWRHSETYIGLSYTY